MRFPTPPFTGFVQAAGIVLYVQLFILLLPVLERVEHSPAPRGAGVFLLIFSLSVLVSALITLSRPVFLAFHGRWREAFTVLAWMAFWLACAIGVLIVLLSR